MHGSGLGLPRIPLLISTLLLGACAGTGGPKVHELRCKCESEPPCLVDLETMRVLVPASGRPRYDLSIWPIGAGAMSVDGDGRRSIALAGRGDRSSFLALARRLDSWSIREVASAAEAVGIVAGERPAEYWTPRRYTVEAGAVLVVRNSGRSYGADGRLTGTDIGALVYVKAIDGRREVILLVARPPEGKGG